MKKKIVTNYSWVRFFLWIQNNPDVKYSPLRSPGGVFLEEASRNRKRKSDILLGTWEVRSLYRADSLMAAVRELARYKLDVVGVQEVRWDKGGTVRAGDYIFSMEKHGVSK